MTDDEQTFSLKPWRSQWAHLPLSFAPFAVMLPLMLLASWLQTRGLEQVATTLGWVAGLGFAGMVFAIPLSWRRLQSRGAVVLRLGRGHAELSTPDGRSLAVTALTPESVRFGVFEYMVTYRHARGPYRSPLVEIAFPERRLVIGGESVAAGAEGTPEAKPGFLVAAADWARLVAALTRPEARSRRPG